MSTGIAPNRAAMLDVIERRMDAAYAARRTCKPGTPEYVAADAGIEAVYADLRAWNLGEYACSQEPHPGAEFYRDGGCAECGFTPSAESAS